jgi:hypothetical protein
MSEDLPAEEGLSHRHLHRRVVCQIITKRDQVQAKF